MRYLNRAQAWKAIARKLLEDGEIRTGLCREVSVLLEEDRVSMATYRAMNAQLRAHVDEARDAGIVFGGYLYGNREGTSYTEMCGWGRCHEERAFGCLWMALEAAEERAL